MRENEPSEMPCAVFFSLKRRRSRNFGFGACSFYIFMLWIRSIFGSVLTRYCTLLLRFYDGFFHLRSDWMISIRFLVHGLRMYLSTRKVINTDANCIYQQLSGKAWEADSSIGQNSCCEEYAPHTAKCILGGVFRLHNIRISCRTVVLVWLSRGQCLHVIGPCCTLARLTVMNARRSK